MEPTTDITEEPQDCPATKTESSPANIQNGSRTGVARPDHLTTTPKSPGLHIQEDSSVPLVMMCASQVLANATNEPEALPSRNGLETSEPITAAPDTPILHTSSAVALPVAEVEPKSPSGGQADSAPVPVPSPKEIADISLPDPEARSLSPADKRTHEAQLSDHLPHPSSTTFDLQQMQHLIQAELASFAKKFQVEEKSQMQEVVRAEIAGLQERLDSDANPRSVAAKTLQESIDNYDKKVTASTTEVSALATEVGKVSGLQSTVENLVSELQSISAILQGSEDVSPEAKVKLEGAIEGATSLKGAVVDLTQQLIQQRREQAPLKESMDQLLRQIGPESSTLSALTGIPTIANELKTAADHLVATNKGWESHAGEFATVVLDNFFKQAEARAQNVLSNPKPERSSSPSEDNVASQIKTLKYCFYSIFGDFVAAGKVVASPQVSRVPSAVADPADQPAVQTIDICASSPLTEQDNTFTQAPSGVAEPEVEEGEIEDRVEDDLALDGDDEMSCKSPRAPSEIDDELAAFVDDNTPGSRTRSGGKGKRRAASEAPDHAKKVGGKRPGDSERPSAAGQAKKRKLTK